MAFADITATRCKTGALLVSQNPKYGYFNLGRDVLVIPEFSSDSKNQQWENFIKEVEVLYKKFNISEDKINVIE